MTLLVVDASVLIASAFTERLTERATGLLAAAAHEEKTIHAPTLFHYELVSVIRKAVYVGRVSATQGFSLRRHLLPIPVTLHFSRELLERAFELAQELNLPRAYDAQYLALAERLGCDVWTGDERLFNGVRATFSSIRWLGELEG